MNVLLDRIVDVLQIVVLPVGGWAIRQLSLILAQLRLLNGRQTRMEAWQEQHEQLDTERFQWIQRDMDRQYSDTKRGV
jgi:hypothetical protein